MSNCWRKKWQPTPVFLPGKSHGWRNVVSYSPWGRKESDTTEWLHIISYEQLYTSKLDNLHEMDKFPETQNLPRLNHKIPEKEMPWTDDGFIGKFYPVFKKEHLSLWNFSQKLKRRGYFQNHSDEASTSRYQSLEKENHTHTQTQKPYRWISFMNTDAKILNKTLANRIQQQHLIICADQDYISWPSGVHSWTARMVRHAEMDQCDVLCQWHAGNNYTNTSIDAGTASDKI